jgi:two-component system sensor histidine kinase PilS (NtrC family)
MPGTERYILLGRLTLYRLLILSVLLLITQRQIFNEVEFTPQHIQWRALSFMEGGLFLLTLIYVMWLRTRHHLSQLARLQCAMDPVLVSGMVVITGGIDSPFHFLNGLAVLNAALMLGRRDALLVAGMAVLLSVWALTYAAMLERHPLGRDEMIGWIILHGLAYSLTAILGGALAARVTGLQRTVVQQQDSLANLAFLHRQMIEAMPYGLISLNGEGRILHYNQTSTLLFGKQPLSLGGLLRDQLPELQWVIDHTLPEKSAVEMRRGPRILSVSASPLHDLNHQPMGALLIIRDLSEQRRLERMLSQREKLAVVGQMAAYMAHEIRNPLASMLSATQMLAPTSESHPRHERLRTIILDEIARLKQLTTDFLAFARPAPPRPKSVALSGLLTHMAIQLANDPRWGPNRRLFWPKASHIDPVLLFDPDHLRQVLWNICLNAAHFTPPDGWVRISWKRTPNGLWRITLLDNGPGMEPEALNRALDPFFTTRAAGTGLGLAVVAQLMRNNGSTITLVNTSEGETGLEVRLEMEPGHGSLR